MRHRGISRNNSVGCRTAPSVPRSRHAAAALLQNPRTRTAQRSHDPLNDAPNATPRICSKVACVCRRSCSLMTGSPALRTCRSNVPDHPSGFTGLPSSRVKTIPVLCQAFPHSARSASCALRHRCNAATVWLSRSTVRRPRLSTPKTRRSRRTVDLDSHTIAALHLWHGKQGAERADWGSAWQGTELVFTREDGTPVNPDGWSGTFERHVRRAGLPIIRLHDLRHTHATLLQMRGVAFGASFSGSCDRCAVRVLGFWRSAAAA